MRVYPKVKDEFETLAMLHQGYSIARYGDGEFKICYGKAQIREEPNKRLGKELRKILWSPPSRLIVGIPTMNPQGPKYENWIRHIDRYKRKLNADVTYYSSFITRPDSAPWIETKEYAESFIRLWADAEFITLVAEPDVAIHRLLQATAKKVYLVPCPHRQTSDVMHKLLGQVRACRPEIVILSCGPAATAMAARLSGECQAIDIGSAGAFLTRHVL